jgi:guanylate kinase
LCWQKYEHGKAPIQMNSGKVIIFSAPSGAGKTTIVKHLLATNPMLTFSVSATTRSQRPTEIDGKDYYFLSSSDFQQKIAAGEFLEYQQVYADICYGTLRSEVARIHAAGKHAIFDLDVQGGINLKKEFGENALSIFVKVRSVDILAKRLSLRNTESEERKKERIAKAAIELSYEDKFDIALLNDDLEKTLEEAQKIVHDFLGEKTIK